MEHRRQEREARRRRSRGDLLANLECVIRVRRYAPPSPRSDVWLIAKLGCTDHETIWGEVTNDMAEAIVAWARMRGIVVETEERPYVRWPIDPNASEQYARDMYERRTNGHDSGEASAKKRHAKAAVPTDR